MPTNKIAIVGKGTAGSISAMHFSAWSNYDIDIYYDSSIKEAAVGEGSQLSLPLLLKDTFDFSYADLPLIDGNYKRAINYIGWGKKEFNAYDYLHEFHMPYMSLHFNALKLQNFVKEQLDKRPNINYIDKKINPKDIDADLIMDCSGSPKELNDKFHIPEYVAVNSVYVQQVYWEEPSIDYTLCIARPYGWVFGIPLANRLSLGYLYNNTFNTKEEVAKDLEELSKQLEVELSSDVNSFSFNNYWRKENYLILDGNRKFAYNGNSSFFLEPLEATTIEMIDKVNRHCYDWLHKGQRAFHSQKLYDNWLLEAEVIIMVHYAAGSKYDTPFWKYAEERGKACLSNANENIWKNIIHSEKFDWRKDNYELGFTGGGWLLHSWFQNLNGLGMYKKIHEEGIYAKT